MRFSVEQGPRGNWRVMLEGTDAPVSEHDTEDEARERLAAYVRGATAAAAPTVETGIARGARRELRDGSQIIIRPVEPEDKALLLEGFEEQFGERSRYQRFMSSKRRLSPRELSYFTDIDHSTHEAIGAIDPISGRGVAIGRFVRPSAEAETAEAAIAVADDWQSRGVGAVLLEALSARARDLGIKEFTAALLTSNRAMLELFERLGKTEVEHDSSTTITLHVCLATEPNDPGLRDALRAAASGDVSG